MAMRKENLKDWDLLSYIEDVTGQKAVRVGVNISKFKKCPLCNGGDHFTLYEQTNTYNTWGHCGGGSIIDFYMQFYGKSQRQAITELLGNTVVEGQRSRATVKKKITSSKPATVQTVKVVDLTDAIIKHYSKHTSDHDRLYFYSRELNDEVIERYKLFKCNPKAVFDAELLPKLTNISDWEYIIPIWRGGKVVNAILRRNDNKTQYGEKTYNLRGVGLEIVNIDYLAGQHKLICICEGVWDALTLEVLGFKAISLNSVNMADRCLKQIKLSNNGSTKFYIFGDNDPKGKELNTKLSKAFQDMGIGHKVFDRYEKYKDINEFSIFEWERMKTNIKECWTKGQSNGYNK